MEVLKFNLSGKTAFFKKPDVNANLYFTYSQIPKVALMGILGAILGFGGYNQQDKKADFPEFYEKLKDIRISIVPKSFNFNKKIQKFNNSVGYASFEQGGNLIVTEQWLENPSWDIYIALDDSEMSEMIKDYVLNHKCKFIPYLGTNDHFANINSEEILQVSEINNTQIDKVQNIASIFPKSMIKENGIKQPHHKKLHKYEENLPVGLEPIANQYKFDRFILTDGDLELNNANNLYSYDEMALCFF